MENEEIEAVIAALQQGENALDDIYELLAAVADREHRSPDPGELQQATQALAKYISEVPYLFKIATVAADHADLSRPMEKILTSLRNYWKHDQDLIPDNLGMIGLLDDAYCSRCAMQAISDQYRLLSGKHLFPFDMHDSNQAVRRILGAPYAADLDCYVMDALNASGIMQALHQMAEGQKQIDLKAAYSLWHHESTDSVSCSALYAVLQSH